MKVRDLDMLNQYSTTELHTPVIVSFFKHYFLGSAHHNTLCHLLPYEFRSCNIGHEAGMGHSAFSPSRSSQYKGHTKFQNNDIKSTSKKVTSVIYLYT